MSRDSSCTCTACSCGKALDSTLSGAPDGLPYMKRQTYNSRNQPVRGAWQLTHCLAIAEESPGIFRGMAAS